MTDHSIRRIRAYGVYTPADWLHQHELPWIEHREFFTKKGDPNTQWVREFSRKPFGIFRPVRWVEDSGPFYPKEGDYMRERDLKHPGMPRNLYVSQISKVEYILDDEGRPWVLLHLKEC